MRLACATCEWQVDGEPFHWAGRVECLKSVKWKTPTGKTVQLLHASAYHDFLGKARVLLSTRKGPQKWVEGIAFGKTPYRDSYFTGRSMYLYTDPITKEQRLIFPVGQDGIVSGRYDPKSPNSVTFSPQVEPGSGPMQQRPLGLAEMDGHMYASAGKFLLKRTKGSMNASWTVVFDMESVTGITTTDEAVGGLRGLTTIDNPESPTGHSLLAAWNPNGESQGCISRFDPNGQGGFDHTTETCPAGWAAMNLGANLKAHAVYFISAYNNILAIPQSDGSTVHLIGYQMMLWGIFTYWQPVSYQTAAAGGSRTAYYAGANYLVRRGPSSYDSRTIMGPRRCPETERTPIHIAPRAYILSPFPQGGVYFGGYDCNFFVSYDTAWVAWGSIQAVHEYPVIYDWGRTCQANYTPLMDFKWKYPCKNSA